MFNFDCNPEIESTDGPTSILVDGFDGNNFLRNAAKKLLLVKNLFQM